MDVEVETDEEEGQESCIEHNDEPRHCGLLQNRRNGPSEAGMFNDTLIFNCSIDGEYFSGHDIAEDSHNMTNEQ